MYRFAGFAILAVCLTSCSGSGTKQASDTAAPRPHLVAASNQNPVAKYLELAGFRLDEKGPGKLQVQFAVINHSDADIGNLGLQINVRAKNAGPKDQPLFSFPATVPDVGPQELKQVAVTIPTKLRVYELPDWQFITADFTVTSPK